MKSDWLKMGVDQRFHLTHTIDSVHKSDIPEIVCHILYSDILCSITGLLHLMFFIVSEYTQFLGETHESVRTGLWVGDCFIYTNSVNRINYYVGGEIVTVSHLDRTMYLLGYVPRDNR
jgi:Coatomer WD associated region.